MDRNNFFRLIYIVLIACVGFAFESCSKFYAVPTNEDMVGMWVESSGKSSFILYADHTSDYTNLKYDFFRCKLLTDSATGTINGSWEIEKCSQDDKLDPYCLHLSTPIFWPESRITPTLEAMTSAHTLHITWTILKQRFCLVTFDKDENWYFYYKKEGSDANCKRF